MGNIEKHIILDEVTERVFQYASGSYLDAQICPGLLEVREVHRLIDGVAYANRVYTWTGLPLDGLNIQLEFESDRHALTSQLRAFDLVMTWQFQSERSAGPHLALDGDHTYWSPC